jgi:hypothetical protein
MLLSFSVMAFTGILKSRELLRPLSIPYDKLPMDKISNAHDVAGPILILTIILHLLLKKYWFINFTKRILSPESRKSTLYFIFGIALAGLAFIIIRNYVKNTQTPDSIKQLEAVEVTDYEGEDLSSISDFRENSIEGPQYVDRDSYRLKVHGLVENELNLTYDEVLENDPYEKIVTLHCVEGWSAKILWEGVLIRDLLDEADVASGANTVIFRAYDGYSTSLPLDFVMDNNILLAYKMNGVELAPERGFPFQVVAETKWGYKWAKWVTEIELSDDENFKGYWENAEYNNDGDIEGPIFEK